MRRYLLDTPLLGALLNNRPAAVALITPWLHAHEASTSILVSTTGLAVPDAPWVT